MAGIQIDGVNNKIDFDDDLDTSISANTDDTLVIEAGGNTMATITATTLTINDGTTITTADNTDTLSLISTDTDDNSGPNLRMYRNSGSPGDNYVIGQIQFEGKNDAAQDVVYNDISMKIADASDGTEDGIIRFRNMQAGTLRQYISTSGTEVVINEDSVDLDFRVESNGNANMLFVDGGNDHVNIGTSTDHGAVLNVESTDNAITLLLASTDTDANAGPQLKLFRAVTGADNDICGQIEFGAKDAAGNGEAYAIISQKILTAANGSEEGRLTFKNMEGGSQRDTLSLDASEVVINEDSRDIDFRVEGDNSAHLLFVNAVNANNPGGSIGFNSTNSDGNFFELNNSKGGVYCANIINSENDASTTLHGIRVFFSAQNKDDNSSNYFVGQNSGAVRVIIHSDGDIVNHDGAYNAISDERIKEQIADASSQWDDIKALKMRKFKFKSDIAEKGDSNALWRLGVVAQELEASGMNGLVKPEVTYKEGDQETKDYPYTEDDRKQGLIPDGKDVGDIKQAKTADVGDIKQYKEVKYSILHTKALKALQEAMTKIEDLQARVTTLEG